MYSQGASGDYIVETKVDNEGNWYRKYKSGVIEQGGEITAYSGRAYSTDYIYSYKFPFPFPNEVFSLQITNNRSFDYYNDVIDSYNNFGFELFYDCPSSQPTTKHYYAVGR